MLKSYDKFVKDFQKRIDEYFAENSEYIYCHEGCSACCEIGEYPFSRIEAEYLMEGFTRLPETVKIKIKQKVRDLKIQKENFSGKRFQYECPFLIEKKCSVYPYRGLTCRTHGLAYLKKDGTVNVPYCANDGLNYSSVYKDGIFSAEPVKENLNIDAILKDFDSEPDEIRPLVNWLIV